MFPLNYVINSSILPSQNIITPSAAYRQLIPNEQKKQKLRRRSTTTTVITTITTISLSSAHTTNISSSISSTQEQQISFEDSYSAETGIKTAVLLGGMLSLVILYLIWKARARLCRSLSSGIGNPHLSTKFDLDYWLKQVDLLEAKELERNRGGQSLYLELPNAEARDNREATALWIADAYRHWRLIQYRQQQQILRKNLDQEPEINIMHYRRRHNRIHRIIRHFLASSRPHRSFLIGHSPLLIYDMRPSIVTNNFSPSALTPNLQHRRASSWPHLKSSAHQTGTSMSALQTYLTRKHLLKRTSKLMFDM